jgi:hypothetical protein
LDEKFGELGGKENRNHYFGRYQYVLHPTPSPQKRKGASSKTKCQRAVRIVGEMRDEASEMTSEMGLDVQVADDESGAGSRLLGGEGLTAAGVRDQVDSVSARAGFAWCSVCVGIKSVLGLKDQCRRRRQQQREERQWKQQQQLQLQLQLLQQQQQQQQQAAALLRRSVVQDFSIQSNLNQLITDDGYDGDYGNDDECVNTCRCRGCRESRGGCAYRLL